MAHKHETACPIPDEICAAYKEQKRIITLLESNCYEFYRKPRSPHFAPILELGLIIKHIRGEEIAAWWLEKEWQTANTGMRRGE